TVYPVTAASTRWGFSTFNPPATRLLIEQADGFHLMDPQTGTILPLGAGSQPLPDNSNPAARATHPAWSPDGNSVPYVANANDWGGQFSQGDIAVLPVTGPDAFGTGAVIQQSSVLPSPNAAVGNADSYPTWSPDSRHLAFAHGSGCRS